MVVEKHPLDCAVLLGQDWLECFGCRLHIPSVKVDIILPAYSETLVRIPTTEKRSRLVQAQELQENIFCASSIVECVNSSFNCLIINCNSTDESLRNFPQTQEFSKLSGEFSDRHDWETRNQVLQMQLRLAHVKEGGHEIRQICANYMDVFKIPGDKLSSTSAIKHYIPTQTIPVNRAITLRNYRIPEHYQEEVDTQIQKMLRDEIIQPCQSPSNFAIFVVPKKLDASGVRKWRICVDFRKLNEATVGDSFPLPNIQDILDKLVGARYFSTLDCASGYWQVPLAEEDRIKTTFSTSQCHYEYLRMPFGLKSPPSTFQN